MGNCRGKSGGLASVVVAGRVWGYLDCKYRRVESGPRGGLMNAGVSSGD